MKLLMLGATGVAGSSAMTHLVADGHDVTAHARSAQKADVVRVADCRPVLGDADDPVVLRSWLTGMEALVDLRVRIPTPGRLMLPGAWRDYVHLRSTAAGVAVDAALDAGVQRVVRDTITMVYADGGEAVLDEASPVEAFGPLAANVVAEGHVDRFTAAAGGVGVVLRFGEFYGPADAGSALTVRAARYGRSLVMGRRQAWSSALHTDDAGSAIAAALRVPSGTYNVVDDEPLRRGELLAVLAGAVGRKRVRGAPGVAVTLGGLPARALARSQRVSAERFAAASGWRPAVPSRRQGWPAVARTLGS